MVGHRVLVGGKLLARDLVSSRIVSLEMIDAACLVVSGWHNLDKVLKHSRACHTHFSFATFEHGRTWCATNTNCLDEAIQRILHAYKYKLLKNTAKFTVPTDQGMEVQTRASSLYG